MQRARATISRTATGQPARVNATWIRATFSGRTGPDRPEDLDHKRARSAQEHAALLAAEHGVSDNLKRQ
jgi:hypothetical protein